MAEYRTLHTKIWQDEWFCELAPDAKLLFIYLVTNRAASVAGIYKLPEKFIIFESGVDPVRVRGLLAEFAAADKAYYQDGVVWVKNLRKYQTYDGRANDNVKKRIQKDIDEIPCCALKDRYMAYYAPADTPGIPMADPSDTHGIPAAETDTDTETETDTDAGKPAEAAGKAKPESPLTVGQRKFLEAFGAQRFKTNIQREAVATLERNYSTATLLECATWASKRGMAMGPAIVSIEKAIPTWGKDRPAARRAGTPDPNAPSRTPAL
jgi:hypothetical protein